MPLNVTLQYAPLLYIGGVLQWEQCGMCDKEEYTFLRQSVKLLTCVKVPHKKIGLKICICFEIHNIFIEMAY